MRLNSIYVSGLFQEDFDEHYTQENDKKKIITNIVDEILKGNPKIIVDYSSGIRALEDIRSVIVSIINKMDVHLLDRENIIMGVLNTLYGYGALQCLIEDDDISDIDFPKYNHGVIKRNGKKEILNESFHFVSESDFVRFLKTFVVRNNGVINETEPHCRVADDKNRLRINVSIPPRNKSASLNIRKHRLNPYELNDLVNLHMINEQQRQKLLEIVKNKKKFLLVGKGASGKTTLLRAMMSESSPMDSFLVMEKDAELHFKAPNFIQQRIKKSKFANEITLCDLVKDGLTMSLDGYIIGEIVGDEAWHIVNAGVTDHMVCGSIHANNAKATPLRLVSLIETYHPGIDRQTLYELVYQAFDYFIYLRDFKVVEILETKDLSKKEGGENVRH